MICARFVEILFSKHIADEYLAMVCMCLLCMSVCVCMVIELLGTFVCSGEEHFAC